MTVVTVGAVDLMVFAQAGWLVTAGAADANIVGGAGRAADVDREATGPDVTEIAGGGHVGGVPMHVMIVVAREHRAFRGGRAAEVSMTINAAITVRFEGLHRIAAQGSQKKAGDKKQRGVRVEEDGISFHKHGPLMCDCRVSPVPD